MARFRNERDEKRRGGKELALVEGESASRPSYSRRLWLHGTTKKCRALQITNEVWSWTIDDARYQVREGVSVGSTSSVIHTGVDVSKRRSTRL